MIPLKKKILPQLRRTLNNQAEIHISPMSPVNYCHSYTLFSSQSSFGHGEGWRGRESTRWKMKRMAILLLWDHADGNTFRRRTCSSLRARCEGTASVSIWVQITFMLLIKVSCNICRPNALVEKTAWAEKTHLNQNSHRYTKLWGKNGGYAELGGGSGLFSFLVPLALKQGSESPSSSLFWKVMGCLS